MFYPNDAPVPEVLLTNEFLLRPLRGTDVELDYDAVISSRALLLLSSESTWPKEGCTLEEDLADLERHEREHRERVAFTYTLMNPAETECLGCLYMNPLERILGNDARSWRIPERQDSLCELLGAEYTSGRPSRQACTHCPDSLVPQEWGFSHVLFFAQKNEERQIQLFEEMDYGCSTVCDPINRSSTPSLPTLSSQRLFERN